MDANPKHDREQLSVDHEKQSRSYALKHYQNIPNCDVLYVEQKIGKQLPPEEKQDVKLVLAYNRFSNRICNRFQRGCTNGTRDKVIACETCALTFWCSDTCNNKDFATHRCLDNRLDDGPLQIAFLAAEK
jgi:hypothetical protein